MLQTICLQIVYLIYMYKQDLALNKPYELICRKTQPNQTNHLKSNSALNNPTKVNIPLKQITAPNPT